jgi:Immunity protein 27
MKLGVNEALLTGRWITDGPEARADAVCERIRWLTEQQLHKVAVSPQWGDWEVLYVDPNDGRYWELTYPEGELQGGGPPQLKFLPSYDAITKYGLKP